MKDKIEGYLYDVDLVGAFLMELGGKLAEVGLESDRLFDEARRLRVASAMIRAIVEEE